VMHHTMLNKQPAPSEAPHESGNGPGKTGNIKRPSPCKTIWAGFPLALPILLIVMISTQGMHGDEGFIKLAAYFGTAGFVAFALMGGFGVAFSDGVWREVARSAVVLGCAGFIGGLHFALCIFASGGRAGTGYWLLFGLLGFVLLPPIVGVVVLSLLSYTQRHK
jgi:peptidoglycan/LPS O-acetylase OafA/YrhL